jgi:heterodisulfide reductase subunit A-like polyferredoxin
MKKPKYIPEFKDIPTPRHKMPELEIDERQGNFSEVELGLSEEAVLAEAARCLSCRRCIGCGLCLAECDQEAVVYDQKAESVTVEADSIIFTSDGQSFNPDRKRELAYCEAANVITSLEFERLVSPAGPFGGYLLKPFDGDIPRSIAFIQCVGSREEAIGADYCSTVCCSRTFSQARQAKDLLGEVDVTVLHRGLRPIGKFGEKDLMGLMASDWIQFTEAAVTGVEEDPETGRLTVTYADGEEARSGTFDMVVLAVGVQSRREFKRHARAGGAQTNKFGFVSGNIGDLIARQAGVAFAGSIMGPRSDESAVVDAIAAASRSLEGGNQPWPGGGVDGEGRRRGKAGPAVFACEYGLKLVGLDASVLESTGGNGLETDNLGGDGSLIDGTYPFLCYKDGRAAIAAALEDAGGLVVVGCHRKSHEDLFERLFGLPPGRVAILGKDQIGASTDHAVFRAVEALSVGLGSAGSTSVDASDGETTPGSNKQKSSTIVVVGGGTSGLAAASELLRRGAEITLIEKSGEIGRTLIDAAIDSGTEEEIAEGFVDAIRKNEKVTILTSSEIDSVSRSGVNISVRVSGSGKGQVIEAGALLLATGADLYAPVEYPFDTAGTVVDQGEFRKMAVAGGGSPEKVVMIQCVGARDEMHPYCSMYCCKQALSNALLYKSNNPDAEITILHKGIRVHGFDEELLTGAVERGIKFVEFTTPPELEAGAGGTVKVRSSDGEDLKLSVDLVVLSLAHSHGEAQKGLADLTGVAQDELGFLESGETLGNPFATPVEGIYACGFARRPVIAEDAFVEGIGAAGAILARLTI